MKRKSFEWFRRAMPKSIRPLRHRSPSLFSLSDNTILLDPISRFVAVVNKQTKQGNVADKVQPANKIFNHRSSLSIIGFRRGSFR
jgi:hypothetical protein